MLFHCHVLAGDKPTCPYSGVILKHSLTACRAGTLHIWQPSLNRLPSLGSSLTLPGVRQTCYVARRAVCRDNPNLGGEQQQENFGIGR